MNSRLAEVTSCLELLEVCYASSRVNFDRAELQKVDLYRMEGMIVQEECQTKKQTCFLGKEEVEHSSKLNMIHSWYSEQFPHSAILVSNDSDSSHFMFIYCWI